MKKTGFLLVAFIIFILPVHCLGQKKFRLHALGSVDIGSTHSMPFWPEEIDSENADGSFTTAGFGMGIGFTFKPKDHLTFFTEILNHQWKYAIARNGQRSTSDWIYQLSDSTDRYTDTWTQDVFFRMMAYELRVGARYIIPVGEETESWIGLGAGFAPWKVIVRSPDQLGNMGKAAGNTYSLFIQGGFNFYIHPAKGHDSGIILTTFMEAGLAPSGDMQIDNLYLNGWNWHNPKGEFVILPVRAGIAFSMF